MKEFADDNFKFDENGRKLSKQVEKTSFPLIASNFSFSHGVFKRLVSQGRQKVSLCGNGVIWGNICRKRERPTKKTSAFTLSQTSHCFYPSAVQVSFSHSVFYPFRETLHHFHQIQSCRRQTFSVWKS